jgi:3-oxoadipyl-CoA thiolase
LGHSLRRQRETTAAPTEVELTALRDLEARTAAGPSTGRSLMRDVFICDAIRTPIGRFGGGLAAVRADDLAAVPIKALMERNPSVDWNAVDEVFLGCANQAGEDNRNVARMALLLAGLPESVPGVTLNRLCASGMDAIGTAFRAIASGEMELAIAGGVESMSRAPFVMGKADAAFSRNMKLEDTTIGWRFINPLMKAQYGVDAMPQTADNVADDYKVSRADQDAFALRSQQRTAAAAGGLFAEEIVEVRIAHKKGETVVSRTSIRAPTPPWKPWPNSSRSMARTRPSPPATPRA